MSESTDLIAKATAFADNYIGKIVKQINENPVDVLDSDGNKIGSTKGATVVNDRIELCLSVPSDKIKDLISGPVSMGVSCKNIEGKVIKDFELKHFSAVKNP